MPDPCVSIVIATWNRKADILRTLGRVLEETSPTREVIVVDNGSTDGTSGAIRSQYPGVKLIEPGDNLGHTGGQNLGVGHAQANYVALLDDDSYPEQESLTKACRLLDECPGVGAVAANVFVPTTAVWEAHRFFKSVPDVPKDVPWFMGCGVILRRDLFNHLGGYSSHYQNYWDDQELSFRILNAGYRIVLHPGALVVHEATAANRSTSRFVYQLTRNGLWFIRSAYRGRHAWEYGLVLAASNLAAVALAKDIRSAGSVLNAVWHGLTKAAPKWEVSADRVRLFDEYMARSFGLRSLWTRLRDRASTGRS